MRLIRPLSLLLLTFVLIFNSSISSSSTSNSAFGADWARFRGPNGSGVSQDPQAPPTTWSDSYNLKWKVALPGPGSSCPIVVGDRIFVTCWTGYGVDRRNLGDQKDLKRNLLCIDRKSGKTIWERTVDAVLPEDQYRGMFAEHGYATHTPVSDGERVYAFFGKSGVVAFDLEGEQLWQTPVGTGLGMRGWGSSSSPILYKNLVIVTASAESESLIALNKDTGKEVWKTEAGGIAGTWGTPILVNEDGDAPELVLAVPYEIWSLNPDTGKLKWYCEAINSDSMCTSALIHDGVVYVVGGRGGAIAVRTGGKGDVTKTHVVWSKNVSSRITTPVYFDDKLYWVNGAVANCIDAKTGERVDQKRLTANETADATPARPSGNRQAGGRNRSFGGRSGGRGGQDYSSPVVADGKLYFISRSGQAYVLELGDKLQQLGGNKFAADDGDFSASPAVSNGELFIRSSKNLYCVAATES